MHTDPLKSPSNRRLEYIGRAGAVGLLIVLVTLLIVPAPVLGQPDPNPQPTATLVPSPTTQATTVPAPKLTLSSSSGLVGASITATGLGFKPGETVEVTFNGQSVGSPTVNDGGSFSLAFTIVTLVFTGVGMLGWRAVVALVRSRRTASV